MASSGETVHTQLAALAESVNSNGSSAVADAGDPVVSSAVPIYQMSPHPTDRVFIITGMVSEVVDEGTIVTVSTDAEVVVVGNRLVSVGGNVHTKHIGDVPEPTQTTAGSKKEEKEKKETKKETNYRRIKPSTHGSPKGR